MRADSTDIVASMWPVPDRGARLDVSGLVTDENEMLGFYRDYSNRLLWPVLHGYPADVAASPDAWRHYLRVNVRVADALVESRRPSQRVIVCDYPLMLVPQLLRSRGGASGCEILFSLRAGFPVLFDDLELGSSLLRGMLGADVIEVAGVAAASNLLAFAETQGLATDAGAGTVEFEERTVRVRATDDGPFILPFLHASADPHVTAEAERLRRAYGRIVLAVDQLTHSHGILQKLLAFEILLNRAPAVRGNVSFLQIAVANYPAEATGVDLRLAIEETAARINAKWGTSSWKPLDVLYAPVGLNTLAALYLAADVLLATRFTPGPHFVAQEFIATRHDDGAALIIGSADDAGVRSALSADAHNPSSIADALERAAGMRFWSGPAQ